jgi:hypothetical protein
MAARLSAIALLVAAVSLAMPAAARSLDSLLIVAEGAEYDATGYGGVASIGRSVVDLAAKLADDIEAGQIEEDGPHRACPVGCLLRSSSCRGAGPLCL